MFKFCENCKMTNRLRLVCAYCSHPAPDKNGNSIVLVIFMAVFVVGFILGISVNL